MSLSVDYMNKLKPEQFLTGPQAGWSYHRGRWSAPYEGIRTVERERGPFGLWVGQHFSDGCIEAKVVPKIACESVSIFICGSATNDELRGYEFAFEPREQRIVLRRHGMNLTTLAEARDSIPSGRALPVKIDATGSRLRLWMGESVDPAIDVTDGEPILAPGHAGIRAWGAPVSIDDLAICVRGQPPVAVRDAAGDSSEQRGLQALCLLLLNLNEVVYID
ncbi:MAG: hypothetical protein EXS36_10835 [Pedosphaera sp.]|nr:hypothetical protein [Pedosphaera sp.]